jgi:hypothetical protein
MIFRGSLVSEDGSGRAWQSPSRRRVLIALTGTATSMSEHVSEDVQREQSEEHDAQERAEASDRDERTVTESGGYGTPERGTDDDA